MSAADVSVVTETLPGSQVGLTIEVPSDQVDRAYDRALNRLSQRVRIEGFRPGKAPRPLVEARVGPAAIREEVVDALVPTLVNQALREHSIDAIDRPRVEIQELERGRPARFTARVSVMPEVRLADLATLSVERQETTVDDEMVERRLGELRDRLAEVEPVEREVREGDVVVADVRMLADGVEAPSESRQGTEVEVRDGVLIPELRTALPGHHVGDVVTVDVTLPEEYSNEDLRGKPAQVELTVRGLKEKRVPELTDEVASQLSGGEQSTAEAFRQAVRDDLVAQARRLDELSFEQSAVKAVVDASRVEVPVTLVDREVDRLVEELERRLGRQGLRLDRYFEYLNQSEEQYREQLRPDAESRIRVDLVLEELGKHLEVTPSEDELDTYIRAESARDTDLRDRLEEVLRSNVARDFFRHRLTRLQVLEALVVRMGGTPPASAPAQVSGTEAG